MGMAKIVTSTGFVPPPWLEGQNILPEDCENDDLITIKGMVDNYFDVVYPDFEPEVVTTADGKEYWLPALKVLDHHKDDLFSPRFPVKWQDMELKAICNLPFLYGNYMPDYAKKIPAHNPPGEECDCGIYGSVHLEEIAKYLFNKEDTHIATMFRKEETHRVLCIIEPSPNAEVIICRKGWRASRAFISEVVGDTISVDETSGILSMSWKRNIDVRKIYENRKES